MISSEIKISSSKVIEWMNLIRETEGNEQYRLLENFWSSQIRSKAWLINTLIHLNLSKKENVFIFGGWYGVLAALLEDIGEYEKIYSIDEDEKCKFLGEKLNLGSKINFIVSKMENFIFNDFSSPKLSSNLIINTSVEHIDQKTFETWLNNMPKEVPIVLQGNNLNIDEHVRISKNLEHFKQQNNLDVIWEGELFCETFTRYMIVGYNK